MAVNEETNQVFWPWDVAWEPRAFSIDLVEVEDTPVVVHGVAAAKIRVELQKRSRETKSDSFAHRVASLGDTAGLLRLYQDIQKEHKERSEANVPDPMAQFFSHTSGGAEPEALQQIVGKRFVWTRIPDIKSFVPQPRTPRRRDGDGSSRASTSNSGPTHGALRLIGGSCTDPAALAANANSRMGSRYLEAVAAPSAETHLFVNGKAEIGDLLQGGISNCWLIAGIASFVHATGTTSSTFWAHPSNFVNPVKGQAGLYDVKLHDDLGQRQTYRVNDAVPCFRRPWWDLQPPRPLSQRLRVRAHGNGVAVALYPLLVEKAMAMYRTSYSALINGDPARVWWQLTGRPSRETFTLRRVSPCGSQWEAFTGEPLRQNNMAMRQPDLRWATIFSKEELWKRMQLCSAARDSHRDSHRNEVICMMHASRSKGSQRTRLGFEEAHAYSVLAAQTYSPRTPSQPDVQLVRVRDPRGFQQGTNKWVEGQMRTDVDQDMGTRVLEFAQFIDVFDIVTIWWAVEGGRYDGITESE